MLSETHAHFDVAHTHVVVVPIYSVYMYRPIIPGTPEF